MSKDLKNNAVWGLFVISIGLALCPTPALSTPILAVGNIQVGHGVTAAVGVAVLPSADPGIDLFAFQFDLSFDPTIMQANAVYEGTFLQSGCGPTIFLPGMIDNVAGMISFTAGSLLGPVPGVSGFGTLATVNFTSADRNGSTSLDLSNVVLLDSFGAAIPFDIRAGGVTVLAIPEPATWLSLAIALVCVALHSIRMARRRRSTNTAVQF